VALKRDRPDARHYLVTLERRVRHLTERVRAQHGNLTTTTFDAREIQALEWAIATCWRVLNSPGYLDGLYKRSDEIAPRVREAGERDLDGRRPDLSSKALQAFRKNYPGPS
jgi:hypothetical protein